MNLDRARTVADAVLYEGYLLYPYRATAAKNQVRWQFGVLAPPAAAAQLGEDPGMELQALLTAGAGTIRIHLRCLHVQQRRIQADDQDELVDVSELRVGDQRWFGWDEAVEIERTYAAELAALTSGRTWTVEVPGGEEHEDLFDAGVRVGRVVRERWPVQATLFAHVVPIAGHQRLTVAVDNQTDTEGLDRDGALRRSLVSAHLILDAGEVAFVSVIDPPPTARAAAEHCSQRRCWPVLVGPPGATDVVLGSPIILYDYPEVAPESAGALFDSTEIDEILSLRVLTMTDAEKAEARATDPRAAEIIDRCENMSPENLQRLHGVLRDPHAVAAAARSDAVETGLVPPELAEAVAAVERDAETPWFDTGGQPWWEPAIDERVQPDVDAVVIDGVSVSKDSLVRLHPSRRADAQDLFFADQVALVTAVLGDVDGGLHVAVVLVDDPAADLHDWYGRYLYFAPDELEPLPVPTSSRKEPQP